MQKTDKARGEASNRRVSVPLLALLLALLVACTHTAPVMTTSVPPKVPTATPFPTPTIIIRPPTPMAAAGDPLADAQQALAAYLPVADAQPLVSTLLSGIADWLAAGGEAINLETILNEPPLQAERRPVTVAELDLTGDEWEDVVVRIPVMGLPLLVFVNDGSNPARFSGYALPPDLETIQTDFPLEGTEIDKPTVQLEDLTGDGVPEALFTTMFAGGSSYRLRPHVFQWHEANFRLIFSADLVSWAGTSDYALEPDPMAKGRFQLVLTYPHLYNQGFDHKMINHPAGQQVWRWSVDAGAYVLFEKHVDLEQGALGLPVTTGDRLRWLTNEGEAVFRAGGYDKAVQRYEEVLRLAEAENWRGDGQEADWQAYAAFRRAETFLLLGQPSSGLPAMQAVAAEMDGDLLGELAQAFLEGYGDGSSPDAAARGVAAMQAVDLYTHFYYERTGALRFPMDANGILYPGAGLAAYLIAHPNLIGNLSALRAGLLEIGFSVEEVVPVEGGDLRITLRLPDAPNADRDLVPWLLTDDGEGWRISLPISAGEWPSEGSFTP